MAFSLRTLTLVALAACPLAAQQAAFNNTGGSVTLGAHLIISGSAVANPPGTLSFDCPVTALPPGQYQAEWVCNGGSIGIVSNDGLTALTGTVTAGTLIETASGGGHGHPTTYFYSFSGTFTGTLTGGGQTQAVRGVTAQNASPTTTPLGAGTIATGLTNANSDYEPIYITDTYNYRVVRMDNINGDNWTTLGSYGSGTNQFQLPWGLAVDAAGRIYVSDSVNCRISRMDDITGKNWMTLGACGSGTMQFSNPTGLYVDPAGEIFVADSGNNRIVRVSDIGGDGWTVFGVSGNGPGQFSNPESVALDGAGKIYVADAGNSRIVRMDDMNGANWLSLGSSGSGVDQFSSISAISLDPAGKIYIADTFNNRIARVDDMTGANWIALGTSPFQFINPYGVSVDPFGTIYIADSRDYRLVMTDDMNGSAWTPYGTGGTGVGQFDSPTTMVAVPAASATPELLLSAASLAFGDTVAGTGSVAQTVSLTNIGSATLPINAVAATAGFSETNTCGNALPVGQTCTVTATFNPVVTGAQTGSLTLNLGSAGIRSVRLTGTGTLVALSTNALNFGNVNAGVGGASMNVTVSNPGTAAAGIAQVILRSSRIYILRNHCPASLAAGANCTITVKFYPQAAAIYTALLTLTDAAGVAQKVTITGTGVSN